VSVAVLWAWTGLSVGVALVWRWCMWAAGRWTCARCTSALAAAAGQRCVASCCTVELAVHGMRPGHLLGAPSGRMHKPASPIGQLAGLPVEEAAKQEPRRLQESPGVLQSRVQPLVGCVAAPYQQIRHLIAMANQGCYKMRKGHLFPECTESQSKPRLCLQQGQDKRRRHTRSMQKTRQRTLAGRASPAAQPRALDVREFYYPQHPRPGAICPATTDYVWGQPLGYGACALPGAASSGGFQPRFSPCAGALPRRPA
jgi:hypothetical protein